MRLSAIIALLSCGFSGPDAAKSEDVTGAQPPPAAAADGAKASKRGKRRDEDRVVFQWPSEEGWQTTTTGTYDYPRLDAPHVVLVIGCTVRRDQLTPYGGHPEATPFLQGLADDGARFDDAIATAPWTKAAATGLLTGRHAVSVGMVELGASRNHKVLPERVPTFAQLLHAQGWQTIGSTANPNLNVAFGLARGFERWHDSHGSVRKGQRDGMEMVTEVLDKIDHRDSSRPMFVQMMLTDTHAPRHTEAHHQAHFADSPEKLQGYQASMRKLDEAVAALGEGLTRRGLTKANTYFIFVADHGEGLLTPPHHYETHGMSLYPSIVRIPWIVQGPGIKEGHVIAGVASGVDLLPTLMTLLEIPADRELPGFDWSHQLRGKERTHRRIAWSDSFFHGTNRSSAWTINTQCQRDFGSAKPRGFGHVDGCFDRTVDPDFLEPKRIVSLERQLETWRGDRMKEFERAGTVDNAVIDKETADQLRMLGYAD